MILFLSLMAVLPMMADHVVEIERMEVEKKQKGGFSTAWVDFPVGTDSPVRRAVIDFIYERMGRNTAIDIAYPPNTCDAPTFRTFLDNYMSVLCRLTAESQQEYAEWSAQEGETYEVDWFETFSILKVAETDRYVSYACYSGEFCGGAHDNRGSVAVTIRKADGKRIEDIFKEDVEEDIQPLLWKYLVASFEWEDEEELKKEIGNFLEANYGDRSHLHLPSGSIYLAPDGIHLLYDPLEVCFWSMGDPEVVIPYAAARPFLTQETLLIEN